METTERLTFDTETINRALQHNLVLFGDAAGDWKTVFRWRARRNALDPVRRPHARDQSVRAMARQRRFPSTLTEAD